MIILIFCLTACGDSMENINKVDEITNINEIVNEIEETVVPTPEVTDEMLEELLNDYLKLQCETIIKANVNPYENPIFAKNPQIKLHTDVMLVDYLYKYVTSEYEYKNFSINFENDLYTISADVQFHAYVESSHEYESWDGDIYSLTVKLIDNELKIIDIRGLQGNYQWQKRFICSNVAIEDITFEMIETDSFNYDYSKSYPKISLEIIEGENLYDTALKNWNEYQNYVRFCNKDYQYVSHNGKNSFNLVNFITEPLALAKMGDTVYSFFRSIGENEMIGWPTMFLEKITIDNGFVKGERIGVNESSDNMRNNEIKVINDGNNTVVYGYKERYANSIQSIDFGDWHSYDEYDYPKDPLNLEISFKFIFADGSTEEYYPLPDQGYILVFDASRKLVDMEVVSWLDGDEPIY